MDRGADNSLLERILASPRRVVVLAGPAASGKTSAAMALYRHFLNKRDEPGRPGCLLLVPNAPAAAAVRRRLLDDSPSGALVSPQVLTFAALAGRILADADPRAGRALSPLRRHLLLRRIIRDLHEADRLKALSSVADTPGLIVALDRVIAELKRAAVEPDALARVLTARQDKARDILEVYRQYQDRLRETETYDLEGRMWRGRDALAGAKDRPEAPGLAGLDALAADGFTDFTPTQLEILHQASGRLRLTLITLPYSADGRERLWQWTGRTLEAIRRRFGEDLEVIDLPAPSGTAAPPLGGLWERVFDPDAGPAEPPPGLRVIAAAGLDAEVAAVARRVKALLVGGAPAGSIAVLARSLEVYRPAIERIFAAHDIPVSAAPQSLTDLPVVRFLLDVAALPPRFEYRRVLRVIKNSYFRPDVLGEDFDGRSVAAAEAIIRGGNVLEGRRTYADAAERLARKAGAPPEDEDDADEGVAASAVLRPEDYRAAAAMLAELFARSEAVRAPRDLPALAETLRLSEAALGLSDDLLARDLRSLEALRGATEDLEDAGTSLADFREALSAVACPPARGESLVDVLDVLDARALRYEHVFLLGLSEGQFPRRLADSSLLGESERLALRKKGVMLDVRGDLTAREMLLFYLAISRSDADLTLSYLESDASGKPGAPGGFLLSLLEPAGGLEALRRGGNLVCVLPGEFIPPAAELACPQDAFNAALAGVFRADGGGSAGALRWAAERFPDRIVRAAAGLWARHRRWRDGECDAFDGRITDPPLLRRLAERFGRQAVFSATELGTFGQCPWQFFGTYVLGLAPLEEPHRELEAVSQGLFCHAVLARTMRQLKDESDGPFLLDATDPQRIRAALEEATAAEAEKVERSRPAYPLLWRTQRERMKNLLADYLLNFRDSAAPGAESLHFELAFGGAPGEGEAPAAAPDVVLDTPAGPVRIRGRIDRVDRVRTADQARLLVIDYKTGRLPSQSDVAEGRNLQAPLYAAAAERLLGEECLGGAFHAVCGGKALHVSSLRPPRGDDRPYRQRLEAAMATVGRFVEAMRTGRFDALPSHRCPSWCPFRQICHYAEARAERKAPGIGRDDDES